MVARIAALLLCLPLLTPGQDLSPLEAQFDRIARESRADVGVSLIHVESGLRIAVRGDHRYPMASVYKLPVALELLLQVNQGLLTLDRQVAIAESDIRVCCTLSRLFPRGGALVNVGELLDLMIVDSDNTAADLVMKLVGGPAVVERRLRAFGFQAINVNRYGGDIAFEMVGVANPPPVTQWTLELQRRLVYEVGPDALREARARYMQDPRDTATPDDMARFLARLQLGDLLPDPYRTLLLDLMKRSQTGPRRLKALLPPDTVVAHKTGTTAVVINDVGIITLPDDGAIRGHLALAAFAMNGAGVSSMEQAIARLSSASFEVFSGKPLPPPAKAKKAPRPRRSPTKRRP